MLAISAVIPTLNAGSALGRTLRCLEGGVQDIVVTDGGSSDGTQDLARKLGARVIEGAPGRGGQLRRGALQASGEWLLFLHADTCLEPGWPGKAEDCVRANAGCAAYFRFALDDDAPQARRLERAVAWRSRVLGLPYGDQGLLISNAHYQALGGFRDIPLMEDVDIVRRIGRRRLAGIDAAALTSATRFRRDGYAMRSARNLVCLGLYFAGASPKTIKRIYG